MNPLTQGVPTDPAKREEWRRKISEANKGKHLSGEHRRKLSEAGKRRTHSEETIRKMSESHKGKPTWMKGKHHTEETRRKISEARKGKHHTEETRRKISEERKGKYCGKKNISWKGDNASYSALHTWVHKHKPQSATCEHCHKVKPLEAANISGKYLRDVNDYLWLCPRCHLYFDIVNGTHDKEQPTPTAGVS